MGKITQFFVEIAIICENMCEEGSESNSGSEEGLNVFGLWFYVKIYTYF